MAPSHLVDSQPFGWLSAIWLAPSHGCQISNVAGKMFEQEEREEDEEQGEEGEEGKKEEEEEEEDADQHGTALDGEHGHSGKLLLEN